VAEDFTWRDGERLVRFGEGVAAEAPRLLEGQGLHGYVLLTGRRTTSVIAAEVGELHRQAD
jgi:hypothetical protein